MIELSRRQLDFGDGLIAEEVGELWEDWMRHVDTVLDDPQMLDAAYQALACRWTHSRTCADGAAHRPMSWFACSS